MWNIKRKNNKILIKNYNKWGWQISFIEIGVIKYEKNGKYIEIVPNGDIISFGTIKWYF